MFFCDRIEPQTLRPRSNLPYFLFIIALWWSSAFFVCHLYLAKNVIPLEVLLFWFFSFLPSRCYFFSFFFSPFFNHKIPIVHQIKTYASRIFQFIFFFCVFYMFFMFLLLFLSKIQIFIFLTFFLLPYLFYFSYNAYFFSTSSFSF